MKKIKLYWRFYRRKFKPWWKKDPIIHSLYLFIVVLGLFLFIVVFLTCKGGIFAWLFDTGSKNETIRFITLGMGGTIAAIGAIAFSHRANAQTEHNKLIEKGHIDERFRSAIENMGHGEANVRIASFHQFYYLAKNQPVNFRKSVFDILCSYLRAMPRDRSHLTKKNQEHPTEECQTLLNILFKFDDKYIFAEFRADMRNSYLVNTNLSYANLSEADLSHANLSNAFFFDTDLSDAILFDADFSDAFLENANLSDANLWGASLIDADLSGANLQGTKLKDVNLMKVDSIEKADFRGATIGERPIAKDDIPTDKGEYYADWNPPPKKEES